MHPPTRHCPLLERPAAFEPLADAPAPWLLRRCVETGFVYLANPPSQNLFREEYAWELSHVRETARRRNAEPAIHSLSAAIKAFRRRFLKRDKVAALVTAIVGRCAARRGGEPIRVVDVGCGQGSLVVQLADRLPADVAIRLAPIGIEISNHLAHVADTALRLHGGRCIHGTGIAGLAGVPASSVDVIVLSSVLEHEFEPLPLLRHCRERLAPHGRVVVKLPNHACVSRRVRGRRWCGYRWPDHVNYFTPRTLTTMAAAAGLTVTRMNVFDRSPLSDSLYAVLGPDQTATTRRRHAA
jgi:2-polyprenyl-3-methyl-5-hydroxy-6-metoxy-1,4-benzoquinol methylase